jgi:endonuclease/exonuclease/phosphatase (EEP) superfamily protein YafD
VTERVVSLGGALVVALALAIVAWPQGLGCERAFPLALLVSLRGLMALTAAVLAVPFIVLAVRSGSARLVGTLVAVLLILFAGVNVAVLGARNTPINEVVAVEDSHLVVLSWNTLGDAPGAAVIAQLAIDSRADVVALPETTRATGLEVGDILAAAGLPMQAFTVAYDETSAARSTTLLVSTSLGRYEADDRALTTLVLPSVVATPVEGTGPTFVAAHTLAPLPPMMLPWQDDLRWAASVCAGDDVIVAGDFNATVDHFATLPHSAGAALGGCEDGAMTLGTAGTGTWPAGLPALLGAPIDHVLATDNWRFTQFQVISTHDGYGSDHRPVVARLSPSD